MYFLSLDRARQATVGSRLPAKLGYLPPRSVIHSSHIKYIFHIEELSPQILECLFTKQKH